MEAVQKFSDLQCDAQRYVSDCLRDPNTQAAGEENRQVHSYWSPKAKTLAVLTYLCEEKDTRRLM